MQSWEYTGVQSQDFDFHGTGSESDYADRGSFQGSGSFYWNLGLDPTWHSLGDGYYTQQETGELAELVLRERREQNEVDATTEVLRKWIK